MSDMLHAATRKGLFTLERKGAADRWEVAKVDFLAAPVTMVLRDPRDGALYAALNHGHFGVKLHRRDKPGGEWKEIPVPAYPPEVQPVPRSREIPGLPPPAALVQIWAMEAGGKEEPGVIWAGTIPGGLFRSRDRGESWELIRPLWDDPMREKWNGGGYDQPGIHSICVDPTDCRKVGVAVSSGGYWASEDAGASWEVRAKGMFAEYLPPELREDPNSQDAHRTVQCAARPECLWTQHHNGVFRSVNGGRLWTHVPAARPSGFGFAVAVHPRDPRRAWFAPAVKDECRVPAEGKVVVSRTRDGGESFEVLSAGLPQEHAYDLFYRHGMDIDATGDRLAIGSTTGGLWVTEDQGERWHAAAARLPPIYALRFAAG